LTFFDRVFVDPQPGAMAGVNQKLELKMFNRIRTIGICPSALFGPNDA
jgi:hypothetical protein